MPNYKLLKSKMVLVGDTTSDLAEYLNLSRVTISAKLNNRIPFSLQEIREIQKKYNLTNSEVYEIFIKRGEDDEQVDCEGSSKQA